MSNEQSPSSEGFRQPDQGAVDKIIEETKRAELKEGETESTLLETDPRGAEAINEEDR